MQQLVAALTNQNCNQTNANETLKQMRKKKNTHRNRIELKCLVEL